MCDTSMAYVPHNISVVINEFPVFFFLPPKDLKKPPHSIVPFCLINKTVEYIPDSFSNKAEETVRPWKIRQKKIQTTIHYG